MTELGRKAGKTVYVIRNLGGYDGGERLQRNELDFRRVGFIRCRSEPDEKGVVWEMWLGLPALLAGELKGASDLDIETWIKRHSVGTISVAREVECWGLGPG